MKLDKFIDRYGNADVFDASLKRAWEMLYKSVLAVHPDLREYIEDAAKKNGVDLS